MTDKTLFHAGQTGILRTPSHVHGFETQRDHDRRELAERFANQRQTRTGAINELADLL